MELAETGSLDLSIFCSTCLVSRDHSPPPLFKHKYDSILSHFLFRYGSLSDPNTAPCATAASPSSTTTAPGWATAWVRRPRSHFTRLDDRSRGMSGRLICIKRHRPLKTSAPFPIVTSNCLQTEAEKQEVTFFFFFFCRQEAGTTATSWVTSSSCCA